MEGYVYQAHYNKRRRLLKKLFDEVVVETLGSDINKTKIKLEIFNETSPCYCELFDNGSITIGLTLGNIKRRARLGYTDGYYIGRAERINKYILHNRHNEVRFIFYHELRHAKMAACNLDEYENGREEDTERDADDWAIKHLEARV